MIATDFPYGQCFDLAGKPITGGRVYYGVADLPPITNPIPVYWDPAGTQPAAQPIPTLNGYPVRNGTPTLVFTNTAYSMLVQDSSGRTVFYLQNSSSLPSAVGFDTGSSVVGYISNATGAVARKVQDVLRERISILDFAAPGTIGNGQNATAALLAAIAYANDNYSTSNYKHQIYLPAGDYLFNRIELQSMRGLTFVGESTMDPTRRKTRWTYAGPGSEDAALVIRSCAYVKFSGILFDINSAESMGNLVRFVANESTAVAPLNKYSNLWITFEDCVFYVQNTITTKPTATIWAKSCGNVVFNRCGIFCGDTNALKLGADTDVDPDTGNQTFANGLCVITELNNCYVSGDIQREKSYQLHIQNTQFAARNDLSTVISRLTISGGALTINEVIENSTWDRSGVTSFTGTLIEGGTHVDSSGLTVLGNQLDGRLTLVYVNRGDAVIQGNRPIAYSGASPNWFVRIGPNAGSVNVGENDSAGYVAVNLPAASILARLVQDDRSSKFLPVLANQSLGASVTLPAAAAWQSFMSVNYKFFGGKVHIRYSIGIKHKDGGTLRNYEARVVLNGTAIAATKRCLSLLTLDECGVMSFDQVINIDPTDTTVTLELQARQTTGAVFGILQSTATDASGCDWAVELLES